MSSSALQNNAWAAPRPKVAIIGGGLAGLAAACALSACANVTLYERRPYLGGRASSYEHPGTGEVLDNCQHILLGCCTNLLDFYHRIGSEQKIRWYKRLTFLEPGGRASEIEPSFLPAPLHNAFSFLCVPMLSLRDKLGIAFALARLMPSLPKDDGRPFSDWLQRAGQTPNAIKRFWEPVLVSALNEDLDKTSTAYAGYVFRESFLKSARAGEMGVPMVPLTELYASAAQYIQQRGGEVKLRSAVTGVEPDGDCVRILTANADEEIHADYAILAAPFGSVARLLPEGLQRDALQAQAEHFMPSPITGIHLWFDREITELDHAVLLDRTIQWMYHKSRIQRNYRSGDSSLQSQGSYVELVVSASKSLVEMPRQEIIDLAIRELAEFFPIVREAKLTKATVVKEVHATFSPSPGCDAFRPSPVTAWPRIFLAGDWVQTGWPATMEGAVRSGYLAAEALAQSANLEASSFLVPDLAARGLIGLFSD